MTATKQRTKKQQDAEEQAQALKSFAPEDNPADDVEQEETDDDDPNPLAANGSITFTASDAKLADDVSEDHRKAAAFDKIAAINTEVAQAFGVWKTAHENAAAKKKGYEALVNELRLEISKAADPAPMPLFDKPKDAATKEVNPADESWKAVKLREALPELTDAVHKKLEDAMLFTMGELANWTAEDGGKHRLTDIPGIGPQVSGKIEEATMAFWARWQPAPAPKNDAEVAYNFDARREYLDTRIDELMLEEGPRLLLEGTGIKKISQLEMQSSLSHPTLTLKEAILKHLEGLGFDKVEAEDVLDALEDRKALLEKKGEPKGGA